MTTTADVRAPARPGHVLPAEVELAAWDALGARSGDRATVATRSRA